MSLISCRDVSLRYENIAVIEHVSFSIEPGDYLCIVGENGSGKTTLLHSLLGLIQPFSGEIVYGDGLHRSEIGYLPQQTLVQRDFPASVREIVISGCLGRKGLRPFYSAEDRARCYESMEKLGITSLEKRSYRELSGGQQQRVLLARALCATTKILLLDEPAAGLDPIATAELYDTVERLNSSENVAVVMVSHDIAAAVRGAGRILQLDSGTDRVGQGIVYDGPAAEYPLSAAAKKLMGGMGHE